VSYTFSYFVVKIFLFWSRYSIIWAAGICVTDRKPKVHTCYLTYTCMLLDISVAMQGQGACLMLGS